MESILKWCERLKTNEKDAMNWFIEPARMKIPILYRQELDKIAFRHQAVQLLENGYVVVPFLEKKERETYLDLFKQAELGFREYKRDTNDPRKNASGDVFGTKENPYVLGGFGAYGNPSSFHNECVRRFRARKCDMIPLFGFMLELAEERGIIKKASSYKVAQLFDRMCKRPKGTSTTKESYHRDLIPLGRSTDCTIGGWIQLSQDSSFFSCEPRTHIFPCRTLNNTSGFALEKGKKCTTEVEVPPGSMLLFFQNMGHCVHSVRKKQDSYRLFSVWLLTTHSTHMMDYTQVIEKQGVPRLASNQKPPMYSANHASFWLKNMTIPWSDRNFIDTVKNKKKDYTIVDQHMKSLAEYKLSLYPVYESWEKSLFIPNSRFVLPDKTIQLFTTHKKSPI